MGRRVDKPDEAWRSSLTAEQYAVCRQKATEPAFSGKLWNCKLPGTYCCVCCEAELFAAAAKFDSGSGWPSFRAPISSESVSLQPDASHGMLRTEVVCRRCDAHLGHVFDDGPAATGLRYCMNSVALDLERK